MDFIPLNDKEAVVKALATKGYAAVMVEGIQGVAGIHVPDTEFFKTLERECKATGTMLILDEIQSGYGRTGKFFAHQYAGIRPDIITCAKGIANGFPMAAVLISPDIEAWKGMLGTTFGGNHLACTAAIAVLDVIESEKLIENAAKVGSYLISELGKIEKVKEVRGRGLMIGLEVEGYSGSELRKKLLFEHHIFTGGAGHYTVRILPALTLSIEEADYFLNKLKRSIL